MPTALEKCAGCGCRVLTWMEIRKSYARLIQRGDLVI